MIFNYDLVGKLRDAVFTEMDCKGKPRGTVTIFKKEARVATNALSLEDARAIGTKVSESDRPIMLDQWKWRWGRPCCSFDPGLLSSR